MKEKFSGFYSLDEKELQSIWADEKTLFIFDTNCLLNLYRCEEQTQKDILAVMEKVSERAWLPFQVALEYQRNRKKVISDGLSSLQNFIESLKKIPVSISNTFETTNFKKNLYQPLASEIDSLRENIENSINEYISTNIQPRVNHKKGISKNDTIRERLDKIINNKVGEPFSQEEIEKINEEGVDRYNNNTPPGFHDSKSKNDSEMTFLNVTYKRKFGDLYLWKEIIKKANDESINNIIFVCDDLKPDWWFELNGQRHGALEALNSEIMNKSNISKFKMMTQSTFLYEAKNYLKDVTLDDASLQEIEQIHESLISSHLNENSYTGSESYFNKLFISYLDANEMDISGFKMIDNCYSKLKKDTNLIENYIEKYKYNENIRVREIVSELPNDLVEILKVIGEIDNVKNLIRNTKCNKELSQLNELSVKLCELSEKLHANVQTKFVEIIIYT